MKIKRYTAPTMRDAMRIVREEQGPDAVILSNRRVEGGVEVVAAIDYDEALVRQALRIPDEAVAAPAAPAPAAVARPRPAAPAAVTPQSAPVALAAERVVFAADPALQQMRQEIAGMRGMLQREIAQFAERELKLDPRRAEVLRLLEDVGLAPSLARRIAESLPADADDTRARSLPLGWLATRLKVTGDDPLARGGAIALVGPTGAGKTTTLAKLAARAVALHGVRGVALVTMDNFRIGAQEQIGTYGRLLGVPVFTVKTREELGRRLQQVADCRVVLVDTAGVSPRDARLAAQLEWLATTPGLRSWLVLPATAQRLDLERATATYAAARPQAVVLTKTDEASRLGGALSAVMEAGLPVAYVADGQRVPEDLKAARSHDLVIRAVQLARGTTPAATPLPAAATAPAAVAQRPARPAPAQPNRTVKPTAARPEGIHG